MLSAADRDILGLNLQSSSANFSELECYKPDSGPVRRHAYVGGLGSDKPEFYIKVARDRETRERAYRLAGRVYREKGYVSADREWIVNPYDLNPDTLTILIEDANGRDAGTVSVIFDGDEGLPSDEIFTPEIESLRFQGRRLFEVARLAIEKDYVHSKLLLTALCNTPFAYGMRVGGCTDLIIEVNPRHVTYYERMMKFKVIGPERPCPRVKGAPAVLLRMDLSIYEKEMRRVGGVAAGERSLFPYFLPHAREWDYARFLACEQQALTASDAEYFGLDPSLLYRKRYQAAG